MQCFSALGGTAFERLGAEPLERLGSEPLAAGMPKMADVMTALPSSDELESARKVLAAFSESKKVGQARPFRAWAKTYYVRDIFQHIGHTSHT